MSEQQAEEDRLGNWLLNRFWPNTREHLPERTRRRISLHLLPILFTLYILAYLDRTNISVAALGMKNSLDNGGLAFNDKIIGFGTGLFFWGYWILEIPSAVSVVSRGARFVFCRVLVLWGICATLMGFIGQPWMNALFAWLPHLPEWGGTNESGEPTALRAFVNVFNSLGSSPESQFYFWRFMLGFFEGGFFPAVIFYLTIWFRARDRARAIAVFMAASPIAMAIGSVVSSLLLKANWWDLPGWRWIFIIEGVAPVLAGIAVLWLLPDAPGKVRWLPASERAWLESELAHEHQVQHHTSRSHAPLAILFVALLTFFYFCQNVEIYGINTFLPSIVKSALGVNDTQAGLIATPLYVFTLAGMLLNGWHSDRTHERLWHSIVPLAITGGMIALAVALRDYPWAAVGALMVGVGSCWYAHLPAFWPIPSTLLKSVGAASAIGFINMLGNFGGYYGPRIIGKLSTSEAGGPADYSAGLKLASMWAFIGASTMLVVSLLARLAPHAKLGSGKERDPHA